MVRNSRVLLFPIFFAICTGAVFAQTSPFQFPKSSVQNKYHVYHGVKVVDPYPWLKDRKSPEVKQWVAAQNRFTKSLLTNAITRNGKEAIKDRLTTLLNVTNFTTPTYTKGKYFFTKRGVIYFRDGLNAMDQKVLDPIAKDVNKKLAALDWWYPSPDGKYVAYGISYDGDEESTMYIQEAATGKLLAERVDRTRSASLAWMPDNSGFFYTRYPIPGSVPKGEEHYHQHVYFHYLGTNAARDIKVFGEGRPMEEDVGVQVSPNGRWVAVTTYHGWSKSEIFLRDNHSEEKKFKPLVEKIHANFGISLFDDVFYVTTDHNAPRFCCYRVDPKKLARNQWELVIPESKHMFERFLPMKQHLACVYLEDIYAKLRILDLNTKKWHEIPVPAMGSIDDMSDGKEGEMFFSYESYTSPLRVYRLDLKTMKKEVWDRNFPPLNVTPYVVKQVKYKSKDGTVVPMTLVHKKGIKLNGNNPTVLYGYGGFADTLTPIFFGDRFYILERGGVYAFANIRGGGEFGEKWHRAGILEKKQNSFDDFIAAAEWLIEQKYTSPKKLAIKGESNGGLLVAACVTQRPDLFRAAVFAVAPLDMLHTHLYHDAKRYVPEDGDPADPKAFKWLYAYSPYHRVEKGTAYPAMLILSRENDTRVAPYESRKIAAKFQAATASKFPVLFREEPQAGHVDLTFNELVDIYSFLAWQLGIKR